MGRLVQAVTAVATPVGALYGFAPVQTEIAVLFAARPFMRGRYRRRGVR